MVRELVVNRKEITPWCREGGVVGEVGIEHLENEIQDGKPWVETTVEQMASRF